MHVNTRCEQGLRYGEPDYIEISWSFNLDFFWKGRESVCEVWEEQGFDGKQAVTGPSGEYIVFIPTSSNSEVVLQILSYRTFIVAFSTF